MEHFNDPSRIRDLKSFYQAHILPEFEQEVQWGMFVGETNRGIKYARFRRDTANILVIVNGRAETVLKYAEIIYDFKRLGFSVYSYDHRSQGQSERWLKNKKKGHVDSFDHYVLDLKTFIETVVVKENPGCAIHIFSHSMGAAITALLLAKHQPTYIRSVVFSAPMFEIDTGQYPRSIARVLAQGMANRIRLLDQSTDYAFGQGDPPLKVPFKNNKLTSHAPRFAIIERVFRENPSLRIGGVTFGWLRESFGALSYIQRFSENIRVPTLVFQAGKDLYVKGGGQMAVYRKIPVCHGIHFAKARHEILQENNKIRESAFLLMQRFFQDPHQFVPANFKLPAGITFF